MQLNIQKKRFKGGQQMNKQLRYTLSNLLVLTMMVIVTSISVKAGIVTLVIIGANEIMTAWRPKPKRGDNQC